MGIDDTVVGLTRSLSRILRSRFGEPLATGASILKMDGAEADTKITTISEYSFEY